LRVGLPSKARLASEGRNCKPPGAEMFVMYKNESDDLVVFAGSAD
jgi:hypothetical protein